MPPFSRVKLSLRPEFLCKADMQPGATGNKQKVGTFSRVLDRLGVGQWGWTGPS